MQKGPILLTAGLLSLLLNCNLQDEQRIKLAKRPVEAIMRDRVKTIQLKADEKKKVAIFDLRNDTHQSDLEWLRQGLAEMLALSLAQSRQLNLIASRNVINAVAALELSPAHELNSLQLQSVAQSLGADVLITGRYFFQQDSLRIELEVRDGLSGEIASSHHGGSPDLNIRNIFKMVDPITHQIREQVEDRSKSAAPKVYRLADVSTSSLDAYKHYTSGIRFEESFYLTDALKAFEKAISFDSTFASAYFRLASLHLMLNEESAARPLIKKAMRFSERTSERERLPIQAMDAMMRGEKYNAVQFYNRYIELYPEDDNGHYQLGIYYFGVVFNFSKAIEFLETTVSLNPEHKLAYNTLAYSYAYIGELDHAYNALEKYISLAADEPNPYDSFGEILQRNGRINEAIDKYRLALKKNPLFYPSKIHLANAYLDLGKMNKARHILLPMLQNDSDVYQKINALRMLALTEIYAENLEQAKQYIHQAMSLQDQPYYFLNALLTLEPDSEDYKRQFLEIIQNEKANINRPDFHSEIVFDLVSTALINQVGVMEVRDLLKTIIEFNKDPVLYNVALAYSLVLGDNDEELGKLGRRFAESSLPGVFEYSTPPSWNYYWRFFFSSLKPTNDSHTAFHFLADGLNDFAQHSGNPYFDVQGLLAIAAAEFYTGDPQTAKDLITRQGFPCEGDWFSIGPFKITRGFLQSFWPEEKNIAEWWDSAYEQGRMINRRDSQFDGYINLKEILNTGTNSSVYAILPISSPSVKKARFQFGKNGKLKVWLNNDLVMTLNELGPAMIDRYIVPVRLRPGLNWLMVRLDKPFGELGFYFRVLDAAGKADQEISFGLPPQVVRHDENAAGGF